MSKTKILCILDGFGLNVDSVNNCISQAKMPTLRYLLSTYPWTTLNADGDQVGQEIGLVGNSEVGHMNLGGLKLVPQLSYQITHSSNQSFALDKNLSPDQNFDPQEYLKTVFETQSKVIHLVTLFSTGCIHSDLRHLVGSIEAAGHAGATKIVLHFFSDGRDSDKKSLSETWRNFTEMYCNRLTHYKHIIQLGSLGGRFFGMDRDKNWSRVLVAVTPWLAKAVSKSNATFADFINDTNYCENALDKTNTLMERNTDKLKTILNYNNSDEMTQALSQYKGVCFDKIEDFLKEYSELNYAQDNFDEAIIPACLRFILPSETIWILNFRSDRVKQLTQVLCDMNDYFKLNLTIMAMNSYGLGIEDTQYKTVFTTKPVINTLAETIAAGNKTQLHIAETEKYAHVTFFFNGGLEQKSVGEDWLVIPSNKVESHAQIPAMKAKEITDHIVSCLEKSSISDNLNVQSTSKAYDYIIVNYANPDMVGHCGDIPAGIESMEFLDSQLARLVEACEQDGHSMIIVADHGNMEFVGEYEENDHIYTDTEHNANPVPCILVDSELKAKNTNLESVFENLDKLNLEYSKATMSNSVSVDFRRDYTSQWLNESEIQLIQSHQLPLWYAGVWLLGL